LTLELVSIYDEKEINMADVVSGIFLNQARAEKMDNTKQGQWYSLFLNGKESEADDYINRVNVIKKKNKKEAEDIIRWNVIR
jgi:hypothetical protein